MAQPNGNRIPASAPGGPHLAAPRLNVGRARRIARLLFDRRPGERVLLVMHRHPVVLIRSLTLPLLALLTWCFGFLTVAPYITALQLDPLVSADAPPGWLPPVLWLGWFGLGLLILSWCGYVLLDWREDWLALTTQRVIIMDKALFLRETRREAPLVKVQNVVADYPHLLGTALDFGNISIDTAGVGVLRFTSVGHPKLVREAIFRQQQAALAKAPPPEDRRQAAVRAIVLGRPPDSAANAQPQTPQDEVKKPAVLTWRKHWVFLLKGLFPPVLGMGLLGCVWWGAYLLTGPQGAVVSVATWLLVIASPICAGWAFWAWEDWRNDLYKLDHERLFHIESLPFGLREESKETLVAKITDVMYTIPGPVANLLDFGSVVIKTPGEATEFIFANIPHPRRVQKEIMERADELRARASESPGEMETWLRAYHEATRGGSPPRSA